MGYREGDQLALTLPLALPLSAWWGVCTAIGGFEIRIFESFHVLGLICILHVCVNFAVYIYVCTITLAHSFSAGGGGVSVLPFVSLKFK